MSHLLDTNVISELVARQPNPRVIAWIDSLNPQEVYLSVITIGELAKGIERLPVSSRKDTLLNWLDSDPPPFQRANPLGRHNDHAHLGHADRAIGTGR